MRRGFHKKKCQEINRFSPKCTNHHENVRFLPGKRKEETMTVEEHKNNDEAEIKRVMAY